MINPERWVSCEVDDKGEWKFTNLSPWLKDYVAHLASVNDLSQEEIVTKCFMEGIAMAFVEETEKGKVEIIRRELPSRSERPVIVFGKNGS